MRLISKVCFALMLFSLHTFAEKVEVGEVSFIVGSARLQRAGRDEWRPARVGVKIFTGDALETPAESGVEIRSVQGEVLRVSEESAIVFEAVEQRAGQSAIRVMGGKLWANMKAITLSEDASIIVRTPTATAAIRGTIFRVDVDGDSTTDVMVYEGKVAVRSASGARPGGAQSPDAGSSEEKHEIEGPHEVEGPREVTLEEWLTIVAGQVIRVERSGTYRTWEFDRQQDAMDAWVRFNLERDGTEE